MSVFFLAPEVTMKLINNGPDLSKLLKDSFGQLGAYFVLLKIFSTLYLKKFIKIFVQK